MIDFKKLKSMHKTAKNQVSETTNLLNAVKLKIVTQAKTYHFFDEFSKKRKNKNSKYQQWNSVEIVN